MAGGLMQLVAYGAQDVYLTGQPKVTFFQAVYKRHTNFAMENIQQTVNGTPSNGGRVSVTIARNGDLVGDMYIRLQPTPATSANLTSTNANFDMNWVAERSVADIELTIGGQRIDKHYQTWWRLYAELFLSESEKINYGKMTSSPSPISDTANPNSVYLPLLFFFNRNPGLYLANYVYLDTEERRRFAQKGHEYLIEQVQHTGGDAISLASPASLTASATAQTIRLSFNHPVKELIWCYINTASTATNSLWNFSTSAANVQVTCNAFSTISQGVLPHTVGCPRLANTSAASWIEEGSSNVTTSSNVEVGPLYNFKLVLNGQDRFKEQQGKYFNQYQPYVYHSGVPYPGVYCYSFALQPEEHQPTGTCNFSRIDNAQVAINIKGAATTPLQKMFAVNYNILRIQSGMGGLAFSN